MKAAISSCSTLNDDWTTSYLSLMTVCHSDLKLIPPKAKSTHMWDPQITLILLPFFCFPLEIRIIKMQRDSNTRQKVLFTSDNGGSFHLIFFFRLLWELKLLIPETKECAWNLLWFVQAVKTLIPCIGNFLGGREVVEINHLFGNRALFRSSNY